VWLGSLPRAPPTPIRKPAIEAIQDAVSHQHGLSVSEVRFLPAGAIPRTTSGKLARRACRAEYLGGLLDRALEPVRHAGTRIGLSYTLYYNCLMAETITFRPDEDASQALEVLTRDGTQVSTAVRTALIEAARRRTADTIRAEAQELAADETDRTEARQVLRDMETLRAW
jgi:hypothetical protein